MADHHQRNLLLEQVPLKPLDRLHVEMVGGLIQQKQIRLLKKDLAQGDAHLPAA